MVNTQTENVWPVMISVPLVLEKLVKNVHHAKLDDSCTKINVSFLNQYNTGPTPTPDQLKNAHLNV